uniref:NADH:ubiquinone reductase (H(+)-translocating) n=1 Tax=Plectus acuminatus TaxID=70689 RepID=A0A1U7AFR7_PLEAC|nr:NADH dehydrogenase subunit 5 [Plectus acuminatus]
MAFPLKALDFVFSLSVLALPFHKMSVKSMNLEAFEFSLCIDLYVLLFLFILFSISIIIMFFTSFYMAGDLSLGWFFVTLFLFILSMVMLALADSVYMLFIAWDGLGVSSFFLVMYYMNWDSISGAMVTVMTNRLGDYCLFWFISSFFFCSVYSSMLFAASGLFFILLVTSFTKSAQFPFSSWLPKAMSAPTPVSALVHSSTLVTAGLFLLMKFSLILNYFNLMVTVFMVGLLTMVVASVCALFDPDFKKVIALSTLSQLGFLMISLGLGNIFLSFFHLISHACFKSCLFMQIGFMMHSFYSQQDSRGYNSSGAVSLLVQLQTLLCLFCLSGLMFTSGFVSKDFILEFFYSVSAEGMILSVVFFFGVFLTFLYSIRLGLAMVKMHTYSLSYVIKSELFMFLSFPLIIFSLFLLWWLNLNIFSVPLNFLYLDKIFPLFMLVLSVFVIFSFYIGLSGFLPASMFYMESLVYLSKFSFINFKFLESNLLFINNTSIVWAITFCKRLALYFYFYRFMFLTLLSVLLLFMLLV